MPACDSHLHILDPARFPFSDGTSYLPPAAECASVEELTALHDAHGITHALLVQPSSGYGLDNACLLHALTAGRGRFRGLVQLPPEATEETIATLAAQGCVGVRLDLAGKGLVQLERWQASGLFARLKTADWIVGVLGRGMQWVEAAPMLRRTGLRLMIDHCGLPDVAQGVEQAGFQAVLDLLRAGAAVKLSGADRWAPGPWPFAAATPFVAACIEAAAPENLLWGSDWPHPQYFKPMPNDVDLLDQMLDWVPDEKVRHLIFVDNPAELFGFPPIRG